MYTWPQRKSLRLKYFDYSSNWYYFVTICTKKREDFFGEIIDWKMFLNICGEIAKKYWEEISKHYQNIIIDEFIIMPNHIHWILIIVGNKYFHSDDENKNKTGNENIRSVQNSWNLSNIIKWFKIWCTKEIRYHYNDFVFWWHKSFYDVIIRNDKQLEKSRNYIINNPLKWQSDINNIS